MPRTCRCLSCITPPHLLQKLLESKDKDIRKAALNTLLTTTRLRGERRVRASFGAGAIAPGNARRTIFDCQNRMIISAAIEARTEEGPPSRDPSVNQAFDGLGTTREFYKEVFDRNSIDGKGMRLDGYVHYGADYGNAFWTGGIIAFGDGDGRLFADFTKSLDVIAHELAHGVTEYTAGFEYRNQSGALNESMSDVFGSLVKQWSLRQTADQADWLIGAEIFTPEIEADALRSMKAPGTAYDNEILGKDPQPDHMSRFAQLPDTDEHDQGGVHINSGIPNKAFHRTAVAIGGPAWEAPGHIWYEALRASSPRIQFQEFADTTYMKAEQLYGSGSIEQQAVLEAWREVGIRISRLPAVAGRRRERPVREEESLVNLSKQIEALSSQVMVLTKEVNSAKGKKVSVHPAAA